jgi:hypothetical protein
MAAPSDASADRRPASLLSVVNAGVGVTRPMMAAPAPSVTL